MYDTFKAVNYLHNQEPPIIHRDIKPENILFLNGTVKVADFGWSNMKDRVRTTFCGTPDYLAPEMVKESGHNEKLDVWTLGVLMYELVIGQAPFSPKTKSKNKKEVHRMLEKNILNNKPKYPSHVSVQARKLLNKLLEKDPKKRISCLEALKDPWFQKFGLVYKEEEDILGPRASARLTQKSKGSNHQVFKNMQEKKSTKIGPKVINDQDVGDGMTEENNENEVAYQEAINVSKLVEIDPKRAYYELSKKYAKRKAQSDTLNSSLKKVIKFEYIIYFFFFFVIF